MDALNPVFASTAGVLFNKTRTTLIEFPGGKAGGYNIPVGVVAIGNQAFEDCVNLTRVAIPSSVLSIWSKAFESCSNLAAVTIPNSVFSIGDEVFMQCARLTTITFPNRVVGIGIGVCQSCANLVEVRLGSGVVFLGSDAFANCPRLLNIEVDGLNANYSSVNGVLYNKKRTALVQYPCGKAGSYVIPSTVIAIANDAFENCAKLPGILIPSGVSSMGSFGGCSSLTSVIIGSGVTNLGTGGITYGYYASIGGMFANCPRLMSITVDARNPSYSSLGGVLFDKAQTTLLQYPPGKKGSYTIPNSVVNIMDYAFEGCVGLKNVTIPNSVTNLGNQTFTDCTGLTNINFGTGITSLESDFNDCTNLASVFFSGNAPVSDYYPSFGNAHPTVYYLPGTSGWDSFSSSEGVPTVMFHAPNPNGSLQVNVNPYEAVNAGAQWQVDGGLLQPAGATVAGLTVGQHTVNFISVSGWITPASQIVSVSSNSTTYAIGFYALTGLAAFMCQTNADNTLTIVGYAGLGGDVTIPNAINGLTVTGIGDGAFENNPALTSVTIPGSVVNLGNWIFIGCTNLSNVLMPEGISSIGAEMFQNCTALTNVVIPGSVTNIGNEAFTACTSLISVTIPDDASIGDFAFTGCNGLTSVTIPGGASIGNYAFASCDGLTNAIISDGVPDIGNAAFEYTPLTSMTIPGSVMSIGDNAFKSCRGLTNVLISNGVLTIGNGAFDDTVLTSVTIPAASPMLATRHFIRAPGWPASPSRMASLPSAAMHSKNVTA